MAAFSRCRETSTARRCARAVYHEAEQLVKGLYAIFLEGWLDTFPPSQLLIMRLEDYEQRTEHHLRTVLRFLRLPPVRHRGPEPRSFAATPLKDPRSSP